MLEGVVEDAAVPRVHPPLNLLVFAAAAVAVSAALLLLDSLFVDIVGYLLASVVAIALVGIFHRNDLQRRKNPFYVAHPSLSRWAALVAVLGVLVSAVHTWSIATALAK